MRSAIGATLFICLACGTADAQMSVRKYHFIPVTQPEMDEEMPFYLNDRAVIEEVKATPEHLAKVRMWYEIFVPKARRRLQAAYRNAKGDQGDEAYDRVENEIDDELERQIEPLLIPQAFKRLKQIDLQRRGLLAFQRTKVIKALNLTGEQVEKLNRAVAETTMDKALEILSETQHTTWKELIGPPFDFNKLRYRNTKPDRKPSKTEEEGTDLYRFFNQSS